LAPELFPALGLKRCGPLLTKLLYTHRTCGLCRYALKRRLLLPLGEGQGPLLAKLFKVGLLRAPNASLCQRQGRALTREFGRSFRLQ
jgi:hypothetical protein